MVFNQFVIFIAGILILLVSSELFIRKAQQLSLSVKISPLIIGSVIVAIGTSLAELSVSTLAALKGDTGLAIGNIVGSNITNIFLVLPVAIIFGKIRIGTTKTQKSVLLLMVLTAVFILLINFMTVTMITGLILLSICIWFTLTIFSWGISGRIGEDKLRFSKTLKKPFGKSDFFSLSAAILGILAGGNLTVVATENIALYTGLSTTILGLSLTAVATSLPELAVTIFGVKSHDGKMTIGNIIGSNVYNLLLVGGISALFAGSFVLPVRNWAFLVLSTLTLYAIIRHYKGKVVPVFAGLGLLVFFIIYILSLH